MIKWYLIGIVSLLKSLAVPTASAHGENLGGLRTSIASVFASQTGAALNSNLLNGAGSNDTAALQAVLDRAETGKPVRLVIDGVALVSGLNVYGNTTLECVAGAGLYLKDGSSHAIIRNVHRSRAAIIDAHITLRGCFLNGDRTHQSGVDAQPQDPTYSGPSNKEADGTYIACLQFLGVNDLIIENVTLWNIRAFGALIGNSAMLHRVLLITRRSGSA